MCKTGRGASGTPIVWKYIDRADSPEQLHKRCRASARALQRLLDGALAADEQHLNLSLHQGDLLVQISKLQVSSSIVDSSGSLGPLWKAAPRRPLLYCLKPPLVLLFEITPLRLRFERLYASAGAAFLCGVAGRPYP